MLKTLRGYVRCLTPFGLIDHHRLQFNMNRLGLPSTREMADAVETCRYELWPIFLRKSLSPWALVDVGANEGSFVKAVRQLAPLSAVYAFEPQDECQRSLRAAVGNFANGVVHQVAVGNRSGNVELICTENNKLSSVLNPTSEIEQYYSSFDFEKKQIVSVRMVQLDEIIPCGTQVGLLKIDVQGYELAVLRGAVKTLKNTAAILLELNYVAHYEGGASFDEVYDEVRQLGFRIHGISNPYSGSDGPLWADALFVNQHAQR